MQGNINLGYEQTSVKMTIFRLTGNNQLLEPFKLSSGPKNVSAHTLSGEKPNTFSVEAVYSMLSLQGHLHVYNKSVQK